MSQITKQEWGKTSQGELVHLYTLKNKNGASTSILTYGGMVVSLLVPDRSGKLVDVVIGFDDLEGYQKDVAYIGALVGRYANRIAKGKFTLNGKEYTLACNHHGTNHIHGGVHGFNSKVWKAEEKTTDQGPSLILTCFSKDGEENYPGNLNVKVVYTFTDQNALRIDYEATTDEDTIINLTNHAYFNFSGADNILDHVLTINASHYTPVNSDSIPLGTIASVNGTPLDFNTPTSLGARIEEDFEPLKIGHGYDINYVIRKDKPDELTQAAVVTHEGSGIKMLVQTTNPGIQLYTGNFLDVKKGKNGKSYGKYSSFCLETQHFPDSINHKEFPSTVLHPGEKYSHTTIYTFETFQK
eukprot:TRINITY_DN1715_c0_g1_i1.p1 TRINITY_DN1715_c0_g1~~TRINITY_DN1715_c0_g1_i1.p1  ORF type:complete len:372 (-),score=72.86 TRINITY_DN1715_c0_g1_i1:64-1128(-)